MENNCLLSFSANATDFESRIHFTRKRKDTLFYHIVNNVEVGYFYLFLIIQVYNQ